MKSKNNIYISFEDLCNLISNEVLITTSSPKSVEKYLRAILKVILRQLELHGKIYFKDFGTFEIRERKSGNREVYNPNKQRSEIVYVKPKRIVTFRPSSKLDYMINENNFKITRKDKTIEHNKKPSRRIDNTAKLLNRANLRKEKLYEKYIHGTEIY